MGIRGCLYVHIRMLALTVHQQYRIFTHYSIAEVFQNLQSGRALTSFTKSWLGTNNMNLPDTELFIWALKSWGQAFKFGTFYYSTDS